MARNTNISFIETEDLKPKEITEKFTEYEEIFEKLQSQIELYQNEHQGLRKEISLLIEENKTLSNNYEELLQTKISNLEYEADKFQNNTTSNLQNQISIISQEKDITYDLWQNALKTIDHLEEELKLCRGSPHSYINKNNLEKVKQSHDLEIKEIQKQMKLVINQIEEKNKINLDNLEKRSQELALEGQQTALQNLKEKDRGIDKLKDKLTEALLTNNKLTNELEKQSELINTLLIQDQEAKEKVLESVILIETAIAEKDSILAKESNYKDEIEKLRKTVEEIIKEADEKVKLEAEVIKDQYNNNLKRVLEDMKLLKSELNEKSLQLERATKECKMLEENVLKLRKGNDVNIDNNTSKLLILDKKLESTFQKLLLSERKNLQLAAEKESIKMDIENMSKSFERESNAFSAAKQTMERQIKTLQNELGISNRYVEEYVAKIKELNLRMIEMEEELTSKFQLKEDMFEEILDKKIRKLKNQNSLVQKELEMHLKSEHNLNQRWKIESRKISNLFQARIKELKTKNTELLSLIERYN